MSENKVFFQEIRFSSVYRKTAARKVFVKSEGHGKIFVNKIYLGYINQVYETILGISGFYFEKPIYIFFEKFNIKIEINGGGKRSQQEIVYISLRKVCYTIFPETKKLFSRAHLVSQDIRKKERRKYGLKKSRKIPQFSKR